MRKCVTLEFVISLRSYGWTDFDEIQYADSLHLQLTHGLAAITDIHTCETACSSFLGIDNLFKKKIRIRIKH